MNEMKSRKDSLLSFWFAAFDGSAWSLNLPEHTAIKPPFLQEVLVECGTGAFELKPSLRSALG